MKKGFVFLIVFGSILFVAGSAAFGLAIAKGAFKNNSLTQEVTKEYILEDSYSKIDVDIVTADLTFKPSEDDKTKVVSVEKEKIHHTAKVSSDTLVIREEDDRKFYDRLWFIIFLGLRLHILIIHRILAVFVIEHFFFVDITRRQYRN